jgi:hypothetical protein
MIITSDPTVIITIALGPTPTTITILSDQIITVITIGHSNPMAITIIQGIITILILIILTYKIIKTPTI